jgi:inositol polyphosphate 5-phosphatase INPP5B/F
VFTYILTTHRNISSADEAPPLESVEGVDFGEVRYLTRKSRSLTIANTGRVPATFSFVKRPASPEENDRICPEWLRVSFAASNDDTEYENLETDVTLIPGDAVNVALEIFVDDITHVRALNRATMQLDDVLVLRVLEGRDHFIPVRGSWLQSCFGRTVDELIRVPEGGVRALRRPRQDSENAPINRGQEVCWSAPRELFKLTEAVQLLIERAVADKDMIESSSFPVNTNGWPFEEGSWIVSDRSIREERKSRLLDALDNDKSLVESFSPDTGAVERLEVVAEVLLLFLGSIEDGIITTQLWDNLEQDMVNRKQALSPEDERTWILDVLSSAPNHNISFVFLTSMLSKVAAELAPLPRPGSNHGSGSTRSSMDHGRSLSFKGRSSPIVQGPMISRRKAVARRWSEIFAAVIFKISPIMRDRDRRVAEDRKRQILEVFLQGDMDNNPR